MNKTDWQFHRERWKKKDRYFDQYKKKVARKPAFTFDSRVVAWTFKFPQPIGFFLRVILSVLLCLNRDEPMPIGNRREVTNLWKGKPDWYRWFRWHLRNRFSDLKTYYLGYGYALHLGQVATYRKGPLHLKIARFPNAMWLPVPFPYFDTDVGGWEIALGWKSRGSFGGKFRRA